MSTLCSREVSRDSLMKICEATRPATPTGTLMKKIQFQLMFSTIRPPASGPIASAMADTPAQIPIAVPRWRGGNVAVMIDSVAGVHQRRADALDGARADQEPGGAARARRRATTA